MDRYIEINKQILSNNVRTIIENKKYEYYIGIVKANAYGHGFDIISTLVKAGINYLAVSSIEEAVEIRKTEKEIPILCLNPINLQSISLAEKYNITITISNIDYFQELIKLNIRNLKVHIKIDTGLNRLGFDNKTEIDFVYNYLINSDNFILEGLFTHLSSSIYPDQKYYDQIENFKKLTSSIDYNKIPIIHIFKSNAIYYLNKLPFCNAVRLGILMYGVMPEFDNVSDKITGKLETNKLNVQTAFKLISKVVEVKRVDKGAYVGYNNSYELEKESYIATISIGYNEGLHLTNDGNYVLINNKKYQIIGSINMNVITVLVDASIKAGDKVIVIDNIYDYMKHNNITGHMVYGMLDSSIPKIYIN